MRIALSPVAEIENTPMKDCFASCKLDWAHRGYAVGGSASYGFKHVEEMRGSKTRKSLDVVPEEQDVF